MLEADDGDDIEVEWEIQEEDNCDESLDCHYGTCATATGVCDCDSGWTGKFCNVTTNSTVVVEDDDGDYTSTPAPSYDDNNSTSQYDQLVALSVTLQEKADSGQMDTGYTVTAMLVVEPEDVCGVAGGNGTSCLDDCGVANGDGTSCISTTAPTAAAYGDFSVCENATSNAGASERQQIWIKSSNFDNSSGFFGTFKLSFNGYSTDSISVYASTSDIETRLLKLASVRDSVSVTGLLEGYAVSNTSRETNGVTQLRFGVEFPDTPDKSESVQNLGSLPLIEVDTFSLTGDVKASTVNAVCLGKYRTGYEYAEQRVTITTINSLQDLAAAGGSVTLELDAAGSSSCGNGTSDTLSPTATPAEVAEALYALGEERFKCIGLVDCDKNCTVESGYVCTKEISYTSVCTVPLEATIQFQTTTYNGIPEGNSTTVYIERLGDNTTACNVSYTTVDSDAKHSAAKNNDYTPGGVAADAGDYEFVNGTLNFAPGSGTFRLHSQAANNMTYEVHNLSSSTLVVSAELIGTGVKWICLTDACYMLNVTHVSDSGASWLFGDGTRAATFTGTGIIEFCVQNGEMNDFPTPAPTECEPDWVPVSTTHRASDRVANRNAYTFTDFWTVRTTDRAANRTPKRSTHKSTDVGAHDFPSLRRTSADVGILLLHVEHERILFATNRDSVGVACPECKPNVNSNTFSHRKAQLRTKLVPDNRRTVGLANRRPHGSTKRCAVYAGAHFEIFNVTNQTEGSLVAVGMLNDAGYVCLSDGCYVLNMTGRKEISGILTFLSLRDDAFHVEVPVRNEQFCTANSTFVGLPTPAPTITGIPTAAPTVILKTSLGMTSEYNATAILASSMRKQALASAMSSSSDYLRSDGVEVADVADTGRRRLNLDRALAASHGITVDFSMTVYPAAYGIDDHESLVQTVVSNISSFVNNGGMTTAVSDAATSLGVSFTATVPSQTVTANYTVTTVVTPDWFPTANPTTRPTLGPTVSTNPTNTPSEPAQEKKKKAGDSMGSLWILIVIIIALGACAGASALTYGALRLLSGASNRLSNTKIAVTCASYEVSQPQEEAVDKNTKLVSDQQRPLKRDNRLSSFSKLPKNFKPDDAEIEATQQAVASMAKEDVNKLVAVERSSRESEMECCADAKSETANRIQEEAEYEHTRELLRKRGTEGSATKNTWNLPPIDRGTRA
ncbi:hypothetical protein CTAYLR_005329 [Chrysophaeum taylorii]|uniref:EGF-like domain-containing protein n=1 Tax=Chrysophaeum taylorii TaxID=2483200 RepID=A0AAD7U721_9STRA|nr:hypothetical protein CTAYLR_005329 [Chrysophaeum taylorii]